MGQLQRWDRARSRYEGWERPRYGAGDIGIDGDGGGYRCKNRMGICIGMGIGIGSG